MPPITLPDLAIAFVPVALVLLVLWRWGLGAGESFYGMGRMLGQLLIVGYFLNFLFNSNDAWLVVAVLAVMVFAASSIALRATGGPKSVLLLYALVSVVAGGGLTLVIITQGVLALDPWYAPRFLIPLGGMIFGAAMNSISLAAERVAAETARDVPYADARSIALKAALIPITNSLFAVGLVSLPGMMTGQILSGVEPLIAVRYQIMVMCMMFAAAGLSASCFLTIAGTALTPAEPPPDN